MKRKSAPRKEVDSMRVMVVLVVALFTGIAGYLFGQASVFVFLSR